MFKKLKEKITEEVKSSPQRLQQFTQSVSDRLQSSAPSDENFFSIGEDDANSSQAEAGFSNVSLMSPPETRHRRNSNSSVASDVSFLPRYESVANMYHLQSDLDVSASEIEDNASTSSQLGHLSKEQLYAAFQKAQLRYHKYRGRYTDLAKHYKDLERENSKMKSVLVETQDKAIRRVTELKEQCVLEQKAKAHLEAAMRDEIDEKQIKIQTLQTKIELLQQNGGFREIVPESESSAENLENLTKYLNEARQEIESLNAKLQEMKANSIIFQSKEQEYKGTIAGLEREISSFSKREKENNLNLAQNKMELHNEILSKDAEISNLKQDNEVLKQSLEAFETKTSGNTKLENLQVQNKKLIEKLEALSQKCNGYEEDLLRLEQFKIQIESLSEEKAELRRRCEESERKLEEVRDETKKSLLGLGSKITEQIKKDFEVKEEALKEDFRRKLEEILSTSGDLEEVRLKLVEKEESLRVLEEERAKLEGRLRETLRKCGDLEKSHLELIEESSGLRSKIGNLEKELATSQNVSAGSQDKIARLEANIATLEGELETLATLQTNNLQLETTLEELRQKLAASEEESKELLNANVKFEEKVADFEKISEELKEITQTKWKLEETVTELEEKLAISKEKCEAIDLQLFDHAMLETKVRELEEERKKLLETFENERQSFEKLLADNSKLKESEERVAELEEVVRIFEGQLTHLKKNLEEQETELRETGEAKVQLEDNVRWMEERIRLFEEKNEAIDLDNTESKLLEMKLQKLEEERKGLLESFENERRVFDDLLADNSKLKASEARVADLEEVVRILETELVQLKKTLAEQETEFKETYEAKVDLDEHVSRLEERVRLFEEKDEAIDLDNTESKLLEMKLQKLEEERKDLLESFENERQVFEKVLADNSKLKESEHQVLKLEVVIDNLNSQIDNLKAALAEREKDLEESSKIRVYLEENVKDLEEKVRVLEEKTETVNMEKSEKKILEMKLQQLNEEKTSLVENFQKELEVNCSKFNQVEALARKLEDEKRNLQNEKTQLLKQLDDSESSLRQARKNEEILEVRARESGEQVEKLSKELENYKLQDKELSGKIQQLHDELGVKTQQIAELSKKIEQYNLLIEERRDSFNEIISKFSGDSTNHVGQKDKNKENKTLEGLEAKLQHFEITFGNEKEYLNKLLVCLRKFEEKHSTVVAEKTQIEERLREKEKVETELKQQLGNLQKFETKSTSLEIEKNNLLLEIKNLQPQFEGLRNSLKNSEEKIAQLSEEKSKLGEVVGELEGRNRQISTDNDFLSRENQQLLNELEEVKLRVEQLLIEKTNFDLKTTQKLDGDLKTKHDDLLAEVENLKTTLSSFETTKQQLLEAERHVEELLHEKQLLQDEVQELKISPLNLQNHKLDNLAVVKQESALSEKYVKEIEGLREKLTQYKSLDLTNRTSIEFYENELQKLKNQNEKLNRRLDETLVTLNHCTELSSSTEIEYLRNVLYNYMLGKEGVVLARVIAAVCKFDPEQTEAVLAKEQQKQTLLGHLGIL